MLGRPFLTPRAEKGGSCDAPAEVPSAPMSTREGQEHMAECERERSPHDDPRFGVALACLAASLLVTLVNALWTSSALDIDPINLAYGMERFALHEFAPHPPGYWVYVQALRAVHTLLGKREALDARFSTVQLTALLFHLASLIPIYAAVRRLRPCSPSTAGMAVFLTALHPFLLFHSVDAQTHGSEAFAGALLLWMLVRYHARPRLTTAIALGATLALGSAFRPNFVIVGLGPIIVCCARRPRHLLVAGAAAVICAAAWIVPTLEASGGYDAWRLANSALVENLFVRRVSPLSAEAVPELTRQNWLSTSLWLALLALPAALAELVLSRERRERGLVRERTSTVPVGAWTLAASVPNALLYLVLFCSEPGYLSGLVPFLVVWTMTRLSGWHAQRALRRGFLAALAAQLGVFALPGSGATTVKLPSFGELMSRDSMVVAWLEAFDRMAPPGRVLVVGDWADLVVARQAPLHRERIHYLSYYARHWPHFAETTAGFLTTEGWQPIPGPVHLIPGPARILEVSESYDWILIDLMASPMLRASIVEQLACPADIRSFGQFSLLPASCFAENLIVFDGHGVRFLAPAIRRSTPR